MQRQNINRRPTKSANTIHDTIIAINVGVGNDEASAIYDVQLQEVRHNGFGSSLSRVSLLLVDSNHLLRLMSYLHRYLMI